MAKKDSANKDSVEVKESKNESGFDMVQFFKGTQEELGKVVWPTRQQLISESAAVILMVTLVATLIYLVDQFFAWGAQLVFFGAS